MATMELNPADLPSKITPKSTRSHKRRGIARPRRPRHEFDSDDDIQRDPESDPESDASSSRSYVESGSESEPEDNVDLHANVIDGHSTSLSPTNSQHANGKDHGIKELSQEPNVLFSQPTDWSELVLSETADAINGLPVLDFTELVSKNARPLSPTVTEAAMEPSPHTPPLHGRSLSSPRPERKTHIPARQSARQVYQQRLNEDPSYVPVLGDFWGHDDRLMDKSLRSLSNWWRGRWVGRGRGRGFLGRDHKLPQRISGDFQSSSSGSHQKTNHSSSPNEGLMHGAWTHDGYEEMKQREERRSQARFSPPERARGGRGARRALPVTRPRGSTSPSSDLSAPVKVFTATQADGYVRPWYFKKPERTWTKQFDSFLFNDSRTKRWLNNEEIISVKLPGLPSFVVALSVKDVPSIRLDTNATLLEYPTPLVVKLPKRHDIRQPGTGSSLSLHSRPPEPATTMEQPPTDVSAHVEYSVTGQLPQPSSKTDQPSGFHRHLEGVNGSVRPITSAEAFVPTHFARPEDSNHSMLGGPNGSAFQGPSSYGLVYGYPGGTSPNLVYNDAGYPIDASAGGPLYLTSDMSHMAPMYSPQLQMHPHIMATPGLVSYGPIQPEYVPLASFPEPAGMQFSLPKQNHRVEIRAPEDNSRTQGMQSSSALRSTVNAEPFRPASTLHFYGDVGTTPRESADNAQDVRPPHAILYQGAQYYVPQYGFGGYDPYRHGESQPTFYQ